MAKLLKPAGSCTLTQGAARRRETVDWLMRCTIEIDPELSGDLSHLRPLWLTQCGPDGVLFGLR
jgi:hypothetical protein